MGKAVAENGTSRIALIDARSLIHTHRDPITMDHGALLVGVSPLPESPSQRSHVHRAGRNNFWDAAVALDPAALELDEGQRFPICQAEALRGLFETQG